jgi:hypothetical protein
MAAQLEISRAAICQELHEIFEIVVQIMEWKRTTLDLLNTIFTDMNDLKVPGKTYINKSTYIYIYIYIDR